MVRELLGAEVLVVLPELAAAVEDISRFPGLRFSAYTSITTTNTRTE